MNSNMKLRVLFIGLKCDYGVPGQGLSYEYVNFFDTLRQMENIETELFPFDEIMRRDGRESMNRQLLERVGAFNPDICFFFLFTDEIERKTIRSITDAGKTVTLNWFADDHWRFEEFSRRWAACFRWVVTTDARAIEKYHRIGMKNVILSQWGFNHFLYKHADITPELDVSFVGQTHSNRAELVDTIRKSGITVNTWGKGWSNGRLSQEEMIKLYSRSRINLNFAESSTRFGAKSLVKLILSRRADDTYHLKPVSSIFRNIPGFFMRNRAQIKGRNFEIPGSGGFLLTEYAEGIEDFFVPGREIATFASRDELCEKIHYFLKNTEEREAVRLAGYRRALQDHTFQKRFNEIFRVVLAV